MSNHESREVHSSSATTSTCQPSSSVYLGRWYDVLCLCSNYHVEHHDFPEVPLTRLPALRRAAPEFYGLPPRSAATTTATPRGGPESAGNTRGGDNSEEEG